MTSAVLNYFAYGIVVARLSLDGFIVRDIYRVACIDGLPKSPPGIRSRGGSGEHGCLNRFFGAERQVVFPFYL